jgi:cupin superfamily protein
MDHRLVANIEKALGWSGPEGLGREFCRGPLPERDLCTRLLTPTRLLGLIMRRSLAPHRLQCLVNGELLHPHRYLTTATARRGQAAMADMQRLGALLRAGCTLVVDEVNTYDPTLEVACRALQWWSHELVQVNAYLTTGEAAGFKLHWDDHDVLIVQLAGEKAWEVRGASRPVPMYRDATPNPDPPSDVIWAGTMRAGDVMHIPRGCWHQATRQKRGDGYSLHVTFGLTKRTGVHWLNWLADQSRQNELFRHDVDRLGPADARADQQLAFADGAMGLVATRSIAEFLAAREQQQPAARHVTTHSLFGTPAEVVCMTEFPPDIHRTDEAVTVRAAGKEITFAARAWSALEPLLSGRPVSVEQLTTQTKVDAAMLAAVLLEEGICAELTRELASGYAGLLMPQGQ